MQCKIVENTPHFIKKYYFYSINNYVQLDELYEQIEVSFNTGKKSFNRKGIEGDRYKIELTSHKWHNILIIAIVEKIKECSLKTITIFPKH